jgi:hypothetical protein
VSLTDLIANQPFSYTATRNGLVRIAFEGRVVTTLSGIAASRFLAKVESASPADQQLSMAKATGHFKHGTERTAKLAGKQSH